MKVKRRRPFMIALLVGSVCPSLMATQILISPGQSWVEAALNAKPGDEIILLPGLHLPALLEDFGGTSDQPIIIRGLDSRNPAEIEATLFGIRLVRPRHVVLQNLLIRNADINGVYICGVKRSLGGDATVTDEAYGNVRLIDITVLNTGDRKKRHAIELDGVSDITIENGRIEGWSGSGIEIIACDRITISDSTFTGCNDFVENTGIRIRAGSSNIEILNNRFENAGVTGLCIGSASPMKDFPETVLRDARIASIFEARSVRVERNIFIGGSAAITMTHSDRVEIHRNTIINPRYFVFCLLQTHDDSLIGATRRCTIGKNLVTWKPDSLEKFFLIDNGVDLITLKMDPNLWWSGESDEARVRLGAIPEENSGSQVFDVDPRLDEDFSPTSLDANGFGAKSIKIASPGEQQTP